MPLAHVLPFLPVNSGLMDDEEVLKRLGIQAPHAVPGPPSALPAALPGAAPAKPPVEPELPSPTAPPPVRAGTPLLGKPALSAPLPEEARYQQAAAQPEPQLHGFKKALDIAGQIALPGIEQYIPGTPGNYRRNLSNLAGEAGLGNEVASAQLGRQQKEATLGQTEAQTEKIQKMTPAEYAEMQARTGLLGAQTGATTQEGRLTGEKADLLNTAIKALSDPNVLKEFQQQLGTMSPDEQAVMQSAFQQARTSGSFAPLSSAVDKIYTQRSIVGRTHLQGTPGTVNGQTTFANHDPISGGYYDQQGNLIPNFVPLPTFGSLVQSGQYGAWQPTMIPTKDGTLKMGMFNSRTGQIVETPNAGGTGAPIPKDVQAQINKDIAEATDADKLLVSMQQSLPDALKGDQQAMINLLTAHVGMTIGQIPGRRLNQEFFKEAQQSSPLLQGIRAKFDSRGLLTGVTLTPQQMQQMVNLGIQRREQAWGRVRDTGRSYGINLTGMEAPGTASTAAGGVARETGGGGTPPAGAKVRDFSEFFKAGR